MAISTYKTFLMDGGTEGTTYTKLVDIKDFPDLGGAPEMIETTTLSDPMQTNIAGIQSADAMTFTANYDLDVLKTIDEMKGVTHKFAVWFGGTETAGVATPTGSEGKFEFDGQISVYVSGGGVNEVVEMIITIAASTKPTPAAGA